MRRTAFASTTALATALLLAGCATGGGGEAPPAAAAAQAQREIPTQLPRNVRPLHYSISAVPDAANLRFAARNNILVQVLEPTDEITFNAAELEFSRVSIGRAPGETGAPIALNPRVRMNAEAQTATLDVGQRLEPGRYLVSIEYTGRINTQAAGLFALDYQTPQGQRRALFTQFQAPDARRFFPGWDEPQFRTPYDLIVTVPAGQTAISNMPQAGREQRADGTTAITFRQTPAMPSYLLFLGVGEFDRITTQAGDTEIGIVTRAGAGEQGRFALEESARIVPWFNEYFGTPYPLPKLDNVAGPGSSQFFGAMENWGAIFTFESILLVDPAITTEANRQSISSTAAHEIAHQWFGNLVTMAWWDDLWLNEGFASWMARKSMNALHPEWEPLLGRVGGRESAIQLDSVATTHPVVQRVSTVEQISQAFDAITYQKGEAVITMLEDYVGEDAWRRGVRSYMQRYRLSNTVSDDFWREVETAAGVPVTAIAHDFTLQPGVPLIRVENASCRGGRTQVTLRQGEFSRDQPNRQPRSWRVPVILSAGGAEARTLVTGGSGTATVPGCGPLLVNAGQTGYYRTLYAPAMLDRLTQGYRRLRPIDQVGLLADNWGLGLAGYQPASEALDLADQMAPDANPVVVARVAQILSQIYGMYQGDTARQAMVARYASARLSPVLNRIGWRPRREETSNTGILRSSLISVLGFMGDQAVVAEANRLYAARDPLATAGGLRTTISAVIARNADPAQWERLRAQAQAEQNPLVKAQLYRLLGATRNPELARRALALALTPEPGATTSPGIISAVAGGHPDLAWEFALQNRQAVEALVDASSRSSYLPNLAGGSADPAMIGRIEEFARANLTAESRRPADIAIGSIRDRVRVRQERLPDITRWFESRGRS